MTCWRRLFQSDPFSFIQNLNMWDVHLMSGDLFSLGLLWSDFVQSFCICRSALFVLVYILGQFPMFYSSTSFHPTYPMFVCVLSVLNFAILLSPNQSKQIAQLNFCLLSPLKNVLTFKRGTRDNSFYRNFRKKILCQHENLNPQWALHSCISLVNHFSHIVSQYSLKPLL